MRYNYSASVRQYLANLSRHRLVTQEDEWFAE
jgi:hypothetical protein